MDYQNWQDELYRNAYEATISAIEFRRKSDPEYTLHELCQQLETMCIIEGNNQGGRGLSTQIDIEATVAALQTMVHQWQNEEKDLHPPTT